MISRPPDDDSRLSSPRAVKSMLLLAGVVVVAVAVFLWVVLTKACGPHVSSRAERGTPLSAELHVFEASAPKGLLVAALLGMTGLWRAPDSYNPGP
jgi:multisubunit Na+/H+ antiporter MnhG subunit